jgi:hypothetical protein
MRAYCVALLFAFACAPVFAQSCEHGNFFVKSVAWKSGSSPAAGVQPSSPSWSGNGCQFWDSSACTNHRVTVDKVGVERNCLCDVVNSTLMTQAGLAPLEVLTSDGADCTSTCAGMELGSGKVVQGERSADSGSCANTVSGTITNGQTWELKIVFTGAAAPLSSSLGVLLLSLAVALAAHSA